MTCNYDLQLWHFSSQKIMSVYKSGRVSGLLGKIGMSERFSLLKPEPSEALALSVTDEVVTQDLAVACFSHLEQDGPDPQSQFSTTEDKADSFITEQGLQHTLNWSDFTQ